MLHPSMPPPRANSKRLTASTGSAPVGVEGTVTGSRIWAMRTYPRRKSMPRSMRSSPRSAVYWRRTPSMRGSRSLVTKARSSLLRDCSSRAAPMSATWAPLAKSDWSAHDCEWLESRGEREVPRSLEDDLYAMDTSSPISRSARHPLCNTPKNCPSQPVLHQFDFGASFDGRGRSRLAGPSHQYRRGRQRAIQNMESFLLVSVAARKRASGHPRSSIVTAWGMQAMLVLDQTARWLRGPCTRSQRSKGFRSLSTDPSAARTCR